MGIYFKAKKKKKEKKERKKKETETTTNKTKKHEIWFRAEQSFRAENRLLEIEIHLLNRKRAVRPPENIISYS